MNRGKSYDSFLRVASRPFFPSVARPANCSLDRDRTPTVGRVGVNLPYPTVSLAESGAWPQRKYVTCLQIDEESPAAVANGGRATRSVHPSEGQRTGDRQTGGRDAIGVNSA